MKMQEFTIKDLENYTGIKAHTIRIWEQRYGLLSPDRTGTNIRKYTDQDLKYLLNVSLLSNMGLKISQIAGMSEEDIKDSISKHAIGGNQEHHLLHMLKMAMLNYDEELFHEVINPQINEYGLEQTFVEVFMPFMRQIGVMWQADVICPAQEHFISALIRQKVFGCIERMPIPPKSDERPVILYLPELEIHDLSMIMMHFLFRSKGIRSVFLGQSVPMEDLVQVYQRLGDCDFVSIFTTCPSVVLLPDYFKKLLLRFENTQCTFHLTGNNLHGLKSPDPSVISLYPNAEALMSSVYNR